jgi:hypothetical protein
MDHQLMWVIAGVGIVTLVGVLWKMTPGFGPFNLRAVGYVERSAHAIASAILFMPSPRVALKLTWTFPRMHLHCPRHDNALRDSCSAICHGVKPPLPSCLGMFQEF